MTLFPKRVFATIWKNMFGVSRKKKYEITDSCKWIDGRKVCRIRAIRNFPLASAGEVGGFIEHEWNLSHQGNCWVLGDAAVYGQARVQEDAVIMDRAAVYENAKVRGNSCVGGRAKVYGDAVVLDWGNVFSEAEVHGLAFVDGQGSVTSKCTGPIVTISGLTYKLTFTDNHLRAGCKDYTFEEWRGKTEEELLLMDGEHAVKFHPGMIEIMNAVLKLRAS
jgi:hypothetical protein